jgi:phospholipase A-2-activating protein
VVASADKTVKLWRNGECIKTLTQHKDIVRSLALVPNIGFLSCSNDGYIHFTLSGTERSIYSSIILWSFDGEPLQETHEHEAFVYSVSALPSGEIVSSSEDRTLKIWRGLFLGKARAHFCRWAFYSNY